LDWHSLPPLPAAVCIDECERRFRYVLLFLFFSYCVFFCPCQRRKEEGGDEAEGGRRERKVRKGGKEREVGEEGEDEDMLRHISDPVLARDAEAPL